jgi:hypothetical protein
MEPGAQWLPAFFWIQENPRDDQLSAPRPDRSVRTSARARTGPAKRPMATWEECFKMLQYLYEATAIQHDAWRGGIESVGEESRHGILSRPRATRSHSTFKKWLDAEQRKPAGSALPERG